MNKIEIKPHEGGDDASLFAQELSEAVSKYAGQPVTSDGSTYIISCL